MQAAVDGIFRDVSREVLQDFELREALKRAMREVYVTATTDVPHSGKQAEVIGKALLEAEAEIRKIFRGV